MLSRLEVSTIPGEFSHALLSQHQFRLLVNEDVLLPQRRACDHVEAKEYKLIAC